MARGIMSGVVWGGVLGLGISATASLVGPGVVQPTISTTAPDATQTPEPMAEAGQGDPVAPTDPVPAADSAPATDQAAPKTPAPDGQSPVGIDPGSVAPSSVPETGAASDLPQPEVTADAGTVEPQADEPVLPTPLALAPMAPQEADTLGIDTEPAALPTRPVDPVTADFDAPEQPQAEAAAPKSNAVVAPTVDTTPDSGPDTSAVPIVPTNEDTPEALPQTAAVETPAVQVPENSAIVPPQVTEPDPARAEPEIAPVDPPATVIGSTRAATGQSDAEAGESDRPSVGTPAITLTERPTAVPVRRPGAENAEADAQSAVPDEKDARPIVQFASPFEPGEDKPLMSIVLIDDGTSPVGGAAGIAALRSFPYPVSFAIDASLPDAADRLAIYRAAGFEVMAMVNMPQGATPADAETAFGVILPRLPEVVGVLEGTDTGFQETRDLADQVTAILAQSGHGLVTQDKGLNTMPKLARKQGVPADPVFRDFDSKGQSATVIRRFLDQAAFKAGQEGAVIMLGRLRPDTISALLLWGLQDRASSVALAPVSALLMRED